MNRKAIMTVLVLAGIAIAGYVAYRWYQARAATAGGGGNIPVGTNLNSIAPELVGGSTGPSAGPAVQMPLHITLTETVTQPERSTNHMQPVTVQPGGAMYRQNGAAANPGVQTLTGGAPLIKQNANGAEYAG